MIFIEFSPQPISKLSDKTYPDFPLKIDFSAFSILYLSPLNSNQPPGLGYRPLIFPIIFKLLSSQFIFPYAFLIFFAYVDLL